ncbi:MAG: MFS transporter [Thermoleophilia bacterium]
MILEVTPRQIRRNTLLLAGCMAVFASALQLSVALATVTFVLVTGIEGLLGLGPAIFLSAGGVGAFVAGRAMDRFGRIPVLASGFGLGIAGNCVTSLGVHLLSPAVVIVGFFLIGAGNGVISLTRTAGGDMYPPERRARGISYVLFGSVFGAILGPAVFVPIFSGRELEAPQLVLPWLASAGILVLGVVLALLVRPDPRRIAERFAAPVQTDDAAQHPETAAPLRAILRRPGVAPALLAGLASFSIMVAVMNLTGHVVVDEHGHDPETVFPIIAAHIVGMYGLVLVVGDVIDRVGRRPALVGGLLIMALSVVALLFTSSVVAIAFAQFGLGLGWVFSFVAASAELVDLARPVERGKLLGFHDAWASGLGAAFALSGGYLLSRFGVAGLAAAGTVVVTVPAALILVVRRRVDESAPALGTLPTR